MLNHLKFVHSLVPPGSTSQDAARVPMSKFFTAQKSGPEWMARQVCLGKFFLKLTEMLPNVLLRP